MNPSSNFKGAIRPNTHQEQVEILKAVIEKKPVYFYRYCSYTERMIAEQFVGTLPHFGMYRYDLDGVACLLKTRVTFTPGTFVKGMVQTAISTPDNAKPQGQTDYHLLVWFDQKDGTLHVEPSPGKKIVLHDGLAPAEDAPLPNANLIIKTIRNKLRDARKTYRTAQPDANQRYLYFSDLRQPSYYALYKMKNCVLMSTSPVLSSKLREMRVTIGDRVNVANPTTVINGINFRVFKKVPTVAEIFGNHAATMPMM